MNHLKTKISILMVCVIFSLTNAYSISFNTQTEPVKVDSTVSYYFSTETDSVFLSKRVYTYTDSIPTTICSYYYDTTAYNWVYDRTDTTIYNAEKKYTEQRNYNWDTKNNEWLLFRKITRSQSMPYDTLLSYQYSHNLGWYQSSKTIYGYTPDGMTSYEARYNYDTVHQEWYGTDKYIHVYSEDDKILHDSVFTWNSTYSNWNQTLLLNYYDEEENDTCTIHKNWDPSTNTWVNFYKWTTNNFYEGENHFKTNYTIFWNKETAAWDSSRATTYYVYANSLKLSSASYLNSYPDNKRYWALRDSSVYTMDENGRIDSILTYELNGDVWDTSAITAIKFNDYGKFTYYEGKSNYDTSTHLFTQGSKMDSEYDENGSLLKNENYFFDAEKQKFVGLYKNKITSTPIKRYEIYQWDIENDLWVGARAHETFYREDNRTDKLVYYSWLAGEWNLDQKTFHYYSAYEGPSTDIESTDTESFTSQLNIYPNPFNNILNLTVGLYDNKLKIYEASGRIVQTTQLSTGHNTINTENLENGVYLIVVESNHSSSSQILIKK